MTQNEALDKSEKADLEVLNPRGKIEAFPVSSPQPRVTDLDGKTIGLYSNSKHGMDNLYTVFEQLLRQRYPSIKVKPAIAYCYAGGMSGNGTTSCANNINGILGFCNSDLVDVILPRRQNLEFKIPILELTGESFATKPTSGPPLAPSERE